MIQQLEAHLSFIVNGLWRASWQASVLAGIVLIVQATPHPNDMPIAA